MQRKISQFLASTAPHALWPVGAALAAGLVAASPAHADQTISTGTTATLKTSAAGNVTIAGTGTLTGSPGAVVTVDSSSNVTINGGGTINAGTATAAVNGSIGVLLNSGVTTTITNTGAISALENFTPSSISGGYLSSNVSGVSGRYGIYGAAGGTINATIANSGATTIGSSTYTGTITIDGEHSAGIQIDGALNGSLNTQGAINVLGDNSYGVKLNGVTGNITIGGTITVTGSAAQGYVQSGDVKGAILIDGSVSNGYSYTDTNGTSLQLSKALVNTNTPVVEIDANVSGGVLINAPTSSTSTDTNRGSITAYGNNPGLQIGGATDITIGAGTTDNGSYALGIDGSITSSSVNYASTPAYGLVIGGRGGNVTLTTATQANGIEIYGSVSAKTYDTSATAILINAGSTVGSILNTGTITASSSTQAAGNLYGIQDLSGSVNSITNQGNITATPTTTGIAAAIDLSHSTGPVTLTQSYTSTNLTNQTTDQGTTGYNPLTATLYATISGDIRLGTGANTININSGGVTGDTYFGAGSTNVITAGDVTRWGTSNIYVGTASAPGTLQMTLNKYAQFSGTLNLYNGTSTSTLSLNDNASFLGTIPDGANLDVTVNGGTFGANAVTTSTVRSVHVASGASLAVYINGTTSSASKLNAATATFDSGAKLALNVGSLLQINSTVKYDVLTATTLTGAGTLTATSLNLPVLFSGSISNDANNVYVTLGRASAAQLGLTTAQTAAYTPIINDAIANQYLQSTLLAITDTPTLRGRFNELLPNYSGGTFDIVTRATRLADKHFDDDTTMFSISDTSAWLEPIVFHGTRTFGDTPGFKTTGGGISLGIEKVTPIGNVGFQLGYLSGDAKAATYQSVKSSLFELGLFWRKSSGPFYIWAGGNVGRESFKSTRQFFGSFSTTGTNNALSTTNFTYNAAGHWAGWSAAFNGGVSYTLPVGEHFSLRPRAMLEYDKLKENHYIESGDNPITLTVLGRNSTQTTATATLAAKWSAGPSSHEGRPFAVELEAGRRTWVAGNLGTTTATFETGDTFSIAGDHLPSAWVGQFSIMQGGLDYSWKLGTDIERGTDKGVAYGVKASISIAL